MNKSEIVGREPLVTDDHAPEVLPPSVGPLPLPPLFVAPQFAALLMGSCPVVFPRRDNRLHAARAQVVPRLMGVLSPVQDQALGLSIEQVPRHLLQGFLQKCYLRRGSRFQENSERSTRTIGPYHQLASLAAFGFAELGPPFFAGMKVPSTKHSFQRICCFSFSCERKARHRFSSVPSCAH